MPQSDYLSHIERLLWLLQEKKKKAFIGELRSSAVFHRSRKNVINDMLFYGVRKSKVPFDELIKLGADIHYRHTDGINILQSAILYGKNSAIIAALRTQGALFDSATHELAYDHSNLLFNLSTDIDALDTIGNTSLIYAIASNNIQASEWFINQHPILVTVINNLNRTALHAAAYAGNLALFKTLLNLTPEFLNSPDHAGMTPVHLAVISGNEALVELLLQRDEARFFLSNKRKENFLHLAAQTGKVSLFKLMFEHIPLLKIDLNEQDEDHLTPLMVAILEEQYEIAKYLLEQSTIDLSIVTDEQETVLHMVAKIGHVPTAQLILNNAPKLLNKVDKYAYTALMEALLNEYWDLAKFLFLQPGIKFPKNFLGENPLHVAVEGDNLEIIQLFIDYCPRWLLELDKEKLPPLAHALENEKVVDFLLTKLGDDKLLTLPESPPSPLFETINAILKQIQLKHISIFRKLITLYATSTNQLDCLHYSLCYDDVQMFVYFTKRWSEGDLEVTFKNKYRLSLLSYAIRHNAFNIANYLLSKGYSTNEVDKNDNTPLLIAAQQGKIRTVDLLLQHGASLAERNRHQSTCLHEAAYHQEPTMVVYLYKKEPNLKVALNRYHETPLFNAFLGEDPNIVFFLTLAEANGNLKLADQTIHKLLTTWKCQLTEKKSYHEKTITKLEKTAKSAESNLFLFKKSANILLPSIQYLFFQVTDNSFFYLPNELKMSILKRIFFFESKIQLPRLTDLPSKMYFVQEMVQGLMAPIEKIKNNSKRYIPPHQRQNATNNNYSTQFFQPNLPATKNSEKKEEQKKELADAKSTDNKKYIPPHKRAPRP